MRAQWTTGRGWPRRLAVPVAAAALAVAALLAGAGHARAAARPGDEAAGGGTGTISTIAGGVGGPDLATAVGLGPCGVAFAQGRVDVATFWAIRQVNPATDWLTTPAGTGTGGPVGNGGPAVAASMSFTCAVATDHSGNLVVADAGHNEVRVVAARTGTSYGRRMTAGHIYPVAGTGKRGYSGDGGPGTSAQLGDPDGVAVDPAGNIIISDSLNNRVRVLAAQPGSFYGVTMTAGDIYTVAGNGTSGYSGEGGPATSAQLAGPAGVAVDAAGNLLVTSPGKDHVAIVAAHTGHFYDRNMTAGDLYTLAGTGGSRFNGDGGLAVKASVHRPAAVSTDSAGNVLIADTDHSRIRVVAERTGTCYGQAMTAGHIYTVAGDGQDRFLGDGVPATSTGVGNPGGVAVDANGNVLITGSGRLRAVAARTGTFYGMTMTAGDIYTVAGGRAASFEWRTYPATHAELRFPAGVTEDQHGNLVVSDFGDQFVRVLAGHTGTFYGRSMSAGRLYNVAGTGSYGDSGDGGPATKAAVGEPLGLAVDPAGNLVFATVDVVRVVAETTGTFYGRQMTAGDIYTIAGGAGGSGSCDGGPGSSAGLNSPSGVAVDAAGNALVSVYPARVCVIAGATGTSYGQHMTAGDIYTVAGDGTAGFAGDGGPATAAEIDQPAGLGVDSHGNILMTDTGNQRVRVVAGSTGTFYGVPMTAGDIYTVAGDGTDGYAGDGGPATSAEFSLVSGISFMSGVTADSNGNLIISDSNNDRVRVVPSVSGTYYGVAMTAGDIYTVAGNGASASFSGDGGPATKAAVREPDGVAVTSAGDLVVADTNNDRVRLVTGWPGAGRQ